MGLDTVTALQRVAVALLLGLLIGIDRERSEMRSRGKIFAGVRTFPIIALTGAVAVLLRPALGEALPIAAFLAVVSVALVSYLRSSATGDLGATTEVAALATFLLGALAGLGELVLAGALGVAVATLLVAKVRLESFSRALGPEELWGVLELAVISVIVLPIVPRQGYGPGDVLNPFEIWTVVVLVSALSFAGFVAMRLLGEQRGLAATGLVGGLVSSTAVTLSMAERSRTGGAAARPLAGAVVMASTIMCARVAVLAGAVDARILPRLVPVVLPMALVGLAAGFLLARSQPTAAPAGGRRISNPFSLRAAIGFAAVYAVVKLVVHVAQAEFGDTGMFVAAALSGCADVDAPTIAFTRLGPGDMGWRAPAAAVAMAAVSNTLVKLGLAVGLGAGPFRRHVAAALGLMAAAGAVSATLVYLR